MKHDLCLSALVPLQLKNIADPAAMSNGTDSNVLNTANHSVSTKALTRLRQNALNLAEIVVVTALVTMFVLASAHPAYSQHQHGTNSETASGTKQFTAGKTLVKIVFSPYPMQEDKTCVFLITVLDQETNLMIKPEKVTLNIQGLDTESRYSLLMNYDETKEGFVAAHKMTSSGTVAVLLTIEGQPLEEPLTFSFSENVEKEKNMVEKMIHKGMEIHNKFHKSWILLAAGVIVMIAAHGVK